VTACHKIHALRHALLDGHLFLEQTERQFHVTGSRYLVVLCFMYYIPHTKPFLQPPARTSQRTHFQLQKLFLWPQSISPNIVYHNHGNCYVNHSFTHTIKRVISEVKCYEDNEVTLVFVDPCIIV